MYYKYYVKCVWCIRSFGHCHRCVVIIIIMLCSFFSSFIWKVCSTFFVINRCTFVIYVVSIAASFNIWHRDRCKSLVRLSGSMYFCSSKQQQQQKEPTLSVDATRRFVVNDDDALLSEFRICLNLIFKKISNVIHLLDIGLVLRKKIFSREWTISMQFQTIFISFHFVHCIHNNKFNESFFLFKVLKYCFPFCCQRSITILSFFKFFSCVAILSLKKKKNEEQIDPMKSDRIASRWSSSKILRLWKIYYLSSAVKLTNPLE